MTRRIFEKRIHVTDPRCKRYVLHDSESRRYAHDTSGLTISSVEHLRLSPILNQGLVGACTSNCLFGLLGTEPYASPAVIAGIVKAYGSFDEAGALKFYSAEETLDGDGPYPPNDNGSTGLTMAKVARSAGVISGWTQVFSLLDFLKALTQYPIGCGTYWYNSMFDTDSSGNVTIDPSSGIAGGHEYECVGYNVITGKLKFANSWGESWGNGGYFYADAASWGKLLADQGDATILTPVTQPAPTPTPVPTPAPGTAYDAWKSVADKFDSRKHLTSINREMAQANKAFIAATGK